MSAKDDQSIAIIGMAGRFPGAANIDAFWTNIRDGVESIAFLDDETLLAAGVSRVDLNKPNYVRASPAFADADKFDAAFFGLSPRDASIMDPAHRIFLEIAWQAVEHAGYTALPEEGPVGVFAGCGAPLYMIENLRTNPELMRSIGEFLVRHTGNDMNFLSTRVSYEMDLRGPSANVQTACSSALVSVHMAAQSLLRNECAMALAGGATVLIPERRGYLYQDGEIHSPDGHCRPFDADSAGTIFGSGAGVVVLKRLSAALDDGDTIHAVIRGSAINNDGAVKAGYLAPGVDGQAEVVASALEKAGVSAESISYIEAHGTGTLVGDPIEVTALTQAFHRSTSRRGFCAIGSVKSNIGHLGEAAGVASLIKAVMALKHRVLPPSLGFKKANPSIDFESSPFFVNAARRPWIADGPLRCGVTALGAGGTNCHVILEEAPAHLPGEGERSQQLILLSAKSKAALERKADELSNALECEGNLDLADAAYTLAVGRRPMLHRLAFACADKAEAIDFLRDTDTIRVRSRRAVEGRPQMVFMFPGGGAQHPGMGAELYETEQVYRDAIDACMEAIDPSIGSDLRTLMFADAADETAAAELEKPRLTLPSLFATEYAMARLLQSWGVVPDAFIGHSMGEYVAACLSGVFSLEDALRLVLMRGRLFEAAERGGMLAVSLSEQDLIALASPDLSIAAVNGPNLSVASGPVAAIAALQATLAQREIDSTRIRIEVAAHSSMLDPVLPAFRDLCRTIRFSSPGIPFVSNVTGDWISEAQATDPEYWVRHLRSTVRFADGLSTVQTSGDAILLEVGPGRTLSTLSKAQVPTSQNVFNCIRHAQENIGDLAYLLSSLGGLWSAGVAVDWQTFYGDQLRNRVPLPTYPFEPTRFWVQPGKMETLGNSESLSKCSDVSDWFATQTFSETPLLVSERENAATRWLVISEDARLAKAIATHLAPEFVVMAQAGHQFAQADDTTWTLNFDEPEHYAELLGCLEERDQKPDHIVYLATEPRKRFWQKPQASQLDRSFWRPAYLLQAIGSSSSRVELSFVATGLTNLERQLLEPLSALILGPAFVAPRELPHVRTRCIDLPKDYEASIGSLVEELRAAPDDRLVALRGGARWTQKLSALPLPACPDDVQRDPWVRDGGIYVITGGLGGIGLEVAGYLARSKRVKLALLSRTGLPDEASWDRIVAKNPESRVACRIAKVRELKARGADVLVLRAQVENEDNLRAAIDCVRATWGSLNGVIHAAGTLEDAPLMTKTREGLSRVLAPKVAGTLALDTIVQEDLDFFILFSSVASYLGLPGQIDYAAANAFLDAFARERASRKTGRTLVVDWNAWSDLGMAAEAHRNQIHGPDPVSASKHTAFEGFTDIARDRIFTATLSVEDDWMIGEHVVKHGSALLPGTGFVELARAAFCEGRDVTAVELTNLTFIEAFHVAAHKPRRLIVAVSPRDARSAEITFRAGGNADAPLAVCSACVSDEGAPERVDIAALRARCADRRQMSSAGFMAQSFMEFGPRWANLKGLSFGHAEALVELKLSAEFERDLATFGIHPALLDMATGSAQELIPGIDLSSDFYVPVGYASVKIYADMQAHLFSHVRLLPDTGEGVAYFDVSLCDGDGRVFCDVARFTMKRVGREALLTKSIAAASPGAASRSQELTAVLRNGISASEGIDAFRRVMAQPNIVQVVASSVNIDVWKRQLDAEARGTGKESSPEGFERPELETDFAAPKSAAEILLAGLWAELLGVKAIGVDDDFFALGGNSLTAVRMFAALKKRYDVQLPLSTLFNAPTISRLAKMLPAAEGELSIPDVPPDGEWSPLVKINAGAPGRTPLFCVHGAGGNVMIFKRLADTLGLDRPFYGLQAQGVDGKLPPNETIEDMASCYVAALRKVQPSGPYIFAGYSGGGIIAYEMAQQIVKMGETVSAIVMIDSIEPSEMLRPITMFDRLKQVHRINKKYIWQWPMNFLSDRNYRRFSRKLQEGRIDETVMTGLEIAGALATEAYFRAQNKYRPKCYSGDVLLVQASEARMYFLRSGPMRGWDKVVQGKIDIMKVDGDHYSIFLEPAITKLGTALRVFLERFDPPKRARGPACEDEILSSNAALSPLWQLASGRRKKIRAGAKEHYGA